jgi:TatD DNase family protein
LPAPRSLPRVSESIVATAKHQGFPGYTPPMSDTATWIDSHAHLTMFSTAEIGEALDRATARGVHGVLVPATNLDDLDTALGIAAEHPASVVAGAGIHPHDASTLDAGVKRRIEEALRKPGVVAVGEIGLDYHYMNSPREDQLAAFEWQLDLALETGLPVILHNRESWHDLEPALAARCPGLRGVAHSFTEGPNEALRIVELGLIIGVSGMLTFSKADNIREMAAVLTPAQVMVETDSPFLAPVPYRGQRNEPSYVVEVGRGLAKLWALDAREVATTSTAVFRALFGLPEDWPRV